MAATANLLTTSLLELRVRHDASAPASLTARVAVCTGPRSCGVRAGSQHSAAGRQLRREPEVALDRVVAGEANVAQAVLLGGARVRRGLADVGGRAGDGRKEGVLQDGH